MPRVYLVSVGDSIRDARGSNLRTDLKGVDKMSFNFDLGRPFRPFEQLMGVLPAASKELIPDAFKVCFKSFKGHGL